MSRRLGRPTRLPALLLALGVGLAPLSVRAQPVKVESPPALTNWQTALSTLQAAGALVGQQKLREARIALSAAATNLPAPYHQMAGQSLSRLEAALKLSAPTNEAARLEELAEICAGLRDYGAAVRLKGEARRRAGADEDEPDMTFAWRLLESGDTNAALLEYERRLAEEMVDLWQDYYRKQIEFIRHRPANLTNVAFTLEFVRERYWKGFEEKADPLSAVKELFRVLPYARDPKDEVKVHQLIAKNLQTLGDTRGRDAWEDRLLQRHQADPEVVAALSISRAGRAYEAEHYAEAGALYRKAVVEHSSTAAYGDALYGLGYVLLKQQKYDEAIAEFERLIASKVNDAALETTESREDYKNYRHRACMGIAECFEAKKDYARALHYAELARDRYKFLSWCKSCLQSTLAALDQRIQELQGLAKTAAEKKP
jgi:tetratricopeptide (TPR) repeat protein